MSDREKYVVLNPTEGSSIAAGKLAERLSTLNGKVLGVISNGKRNSDVFMQHLLTNVQKKYDLKEVIWIDKINASLPIPHDVLEQLNSTQALLSGVGD